MWEKKRKNRERERETERESYGIHEGDKLGTGRTRESKHYWLLASTQPHLACPVLCI